ncbi:unnamed protein product [Cladocopium goreaui]|uniref:Uncharacterized protein n=1 Tax=Cladocopium goreaui TaxID=2562237 RepID=A0A9P1FGW3_9DINO|nr:unnamed protein product [Cladocopium goreaui]|mmetsp:Transcript_60237/g.131946  ORF Transcript_60237/g.131946 Transcript_60237/m.131946 type:complete len:190 (+) Transcript_60237:52-621(+)
MAPKRAAASADGPRAKAPKMPQLKTLTSSNKEELVKLIGVLCRKFPEVRREVQGFSPTVPLEAMLKEIQRAAAMINKKLPWDRYGRGNGDTYAYNRVRSFISAFGKVLQAHLKTVEVSGQEDKIEEFLHTCYSLVLDMHTFNDPKHNGTQSRLKTSLEKVAKKYDVQLGEGSDISDTDDASQGGLALDA